MSAPPAPSPEAALLAAARDGRLAEVDALLSADPALAGRARDDAGDTAVVVAAFRGHRAVAERVGRALGGEAGVWEAALLGDVDALARRLDADPALANARRHDGWPLLHLAGFYGHPEVAALLLARGADVQARSHNATANSALHAALAISGDARVVARLLAGGADVNARGGGGYTPLHLAASRGDGAAVTALLARGADVNARTDDGRTAVDIALSRGHPAVAEQLRGLITTP